MLAGFGQVGATHNRAATAGSGLKIASDGQVKHQHLGVPAIG